MTEFHVRPGPELAAAARALRDADQLLRAEFQQALDDSARPILDAARANALATLPKRGGLAETVASWPFTTRAVAGGLASIRLQTPHDERLNTQGRLRHPVYGNRDRWAQQKVPAGWFTNGAKKAERKVRQALDDAMRRIARRLGAR